uniref:Uncharacterized protein n=1 Tax=Ditylenchus dipsaci TaxID=166011 RepID=A0A915EJL3_9BILA
MSGIPDLLSTLFCEKKSESVAAGTVYAITIAGNCQQLPPHDVQQEIIEKSQYHQVAEAHVIVTDKYEDLLLSRDSSRLKEIFEMSNVPLLSSTIANLPKEEVIELKCSGEKRAEINNEEKQELREAVLSTVAKLNSEADQTLLSRDVAELQKKLLARDPKMEFYYRRQIKKLNDEYEEKMFE